MGCGGRSRGSAVSICGDFIGGRWHATTSGDTIRKSPRLTRTLPGSRNYNEFGYGRLCPLAGALMDGWIRTVTRAIDKTNSGEGIDGCVDTSILFDAG